MSSSIIDRVNSIRTLADQLKEPLANLALDDEKFLAMMLDAFLKTDFYPFNQLHCRLEASSDFKVELRAKFYRNQPK